MAKTAEQKAANRAFRAEKQQLKSAGKAEAIAMKNSGATRQEIQAEKKANNQEVNDLSRAFKSGTYTPRTDLANVRSEVATYGNASYAPNVLSLLDSASENYTNYNIATVNKSGNVTTGVGLDKLVNYELGNAGQKFNTLMDRAETYVGNTYTAADLEAQGVNLRADKKNPGLFKWSTGGDGNKEITYFTQNADGTFTGAGINRTRTEAQDGGFFDSPLGQLALGIGGFYLGPAVGGLMGLGGGTLAGTVGGALFGGTANVLGGGKFGAGALTGGLGGFTGGGGFEGLLGSATAPVTTIDPVTGQIISTTPGQAGTSLLSKITGSLPSISDIPGVRDIAGYIAGPTQPAAPIYDAVSGQYISGGETLSGALTGTGQNLGSFGQLGSAMPFNPANISISPTIPGLETQIGTAGFGTALRPASALAADLVAAGFAPGTAANLAGLNAAGIGATNLLGGATALAPVAGGLSLWDKLRGLIPSGVGKVNIGGLGNIAGLLNPPLPEQAVGGGGFAGADANYDALLAALSAPRVQPRSLV